MQQSLYKLALVLLLIPIGYWFKHQGTPSVQAPPKPSKVAVVHSKTKPKHSAPHPSTLSHKGLFIQEMLSKINLTNRNIHTTRQRLLQLHNKFLQQRAFTDKERTWLKNTADRYQVPYHELMQDEGWNTLLKRVNTVPASIVLAQAALESAWGTSRFARIGHNFFGQWCYKKGCGFVPSKRQAGHTHEVQRFKSTLSSIQHYVHNLNVHNAYREFRDLRAHASAKQQKSDSLELVKGLKNYNPTRMQYVRKLQTLIRTHKLQQYDQHR